MVPVPGFRKLKTTRSEISSDSESDYSDFFYDKSDDSDNESFSSINFESEDESGLNNNSYTEFTYLNLSYVLWRKRKKTNDGGRTDRRKTQQPKD